MVLVGLLALGCAAAPEPTKAPSASGAATRAFGARFPAPYAVPGLSKGPTYAPRPGTDQQRRAVGPATAPKPRWRFKSLSSVYLGALQRARLIRDPDFAALIARMAAAFTYAMIVVTVLGTVGVGEHRLVFAA